MPEKVSARDVLNAYASGYFPMADDRHGEELWWFNPNKRGIIPLEQFNVPRGMKKVLREGVFDVTIDQDFEATIRACADAPRGEDGHWISERIIGLYCELHRMGFAHSVEARQEGRLVGGLYGVSLGNAFFGESMFSHVSQASKVALVHLVTRLRAAGYTLLDTQFVNDHLKQFGVKEIGKAAYLRRLDKALHAEHNASLHFARVTPDIN
ncbi:MAG: leucyl/phenylalanyl-tRNA--protein transferase [Rickettsiales bacterium]|nr:leucyl/phenylalanyl-tRNA--protein transferase [Rickettsiales bacterium]|tara:strand:+ start:152 stop:781 length:630 start_codon:yes stop_codon:yes gene_type:complete